MGDKVIQTVHRPVPLKEHNVVKFVAKVADSVPMHKNTAKKVNVYVLRNVMEFNVVEMMDVGEPVLLVQE